MPLTPPRTIYRVSWDIARAHDNPHDRKPRTRLFASADTAARQVESIRKWEPTHAELGPVLVTNTNWRPVEDGGLPDIEATEEESWLHPPTEE